MGVPVTCTVQRRGRFAAVSSKATQTASAQRASHRLARPGNVFCSISTSLALPLAAARATGTLAYPPSPTTSETASRRTKRRAARYPARFCARKPGKWRSLLDAARHGRARYSNPAAATWRRSKARPPPTNVIRARGIRRASRCATASPGKRCPPVPPPENTM